MKAYLLCVAYNIKGKAYLCLVPEEWLEITCCPLRFLYQNAPYLLKRILAKDLNVEKKKKKKRVVKTVFLVLKTDRPHFGGRQRIKPC